MSQAEYRRLKRGLSVHPHTPLLTAHSLDQVRQALERRYRVERELGRGRTGVVYLAYEKRRGRKLAVRVLSPSLAADPEKREAFLRTAKAARFCHPNIVRIRRIGHAAGIDYVAMDYVDGETLGERVRRDGPLTVGDATRMLYDVARGVARAHGRRVVHGGLTPDDIILERTTGRAVVTDLGFARALRVPHGDRAAYRALVVPFLSPEQVQGKAADERSDVYALGVTAYFAVTGYLPLDGTPGEIYVGRVMHGPPYFGLYNKLGRVTYTVLSVENTFAHVVERCLDEKSPERLGDASELAHALELAPEIARHQRFRLWMFPRLLHAQLQSYTASPLVTLLALLAIVVGAAEGDDGVVSFCAAILAAMALGFVYAFLGTIRHMLLMGCSRAEMIRALRIEAERQGELAAFRNGGVAPGPFRFARRVIYAGVGLAGVGAALTLVKPLPPEVGWVAVALGGVTALVVAANIVEEVRQSPYRAARFWLAVWRGRVGAWILRVAGLGLRRPPVELAAARHRERFRGPSFEELRRHEATRDLVNLAPAMTHRVASRVNAVRACLNDEPLAAPTPQATPPLDWGMRARLELCLERLQFVRWRLGAVQIGDSRRRLVKEYKAVERACEEADALVTAAGPRA